MTTDVPSICLKRRGRIARKIFGERDDLAEICEERDGYCAHCHSQITIP